MGKKKIKGLRWHLEFFGGLEEFKAESIGGPGAWNRES